VRCNIQFERGARAVPALLVLSAALAACATGGGAAAPAAGGGPPAAGWISGDAAKDSLRRAATGAGVGELAGNSVGYYMDVQEAKLREQLDGSGIGVIRKGNDLTLNMPGSLAFAPDSAELNPAFAGALESVATVLKKYDKTVIEVAGHTDSAGSREHNQALSERRAAAVATFLEKRGVLKSRITTIGAGETRPVASNNSADGRARNRRVELTLSPIARAAG
jgi:outer membrane protein OmpA-like peptidoglycan-associated protein